MTYTIAERLVALHRGRRLMAAAIFDTLLQELVADAAKPPEPKHIDLQHVEFFVRGACQLRWEADPGFCADLGDFTRRTFAVVWRYLQGRQTLDGSCSDYDCWLAHEAAKVFGWPNR